MRFTIYKATLLFGVMLVFASFAFAQAEREKGIKLYEEGDHKAAIEVFQKAVENDKKDRDSRLFLGMALARHNRVKDAVKAFKEADKLKSDESGGNNKKIKITAKPRTSYTDSARENGTQGRIKLAVEFGADG